MKHYVLLDMNGNPINNLPDAVLAQQPVTLAQLNAAIQGWKWKEPVRAATTGNVTLSGTQTIDSVALVTGNRVLVKDQATAAENGIYLVASGAWTRATDMDQSSEFNLATVFVSEGAANGNSGWTMTTDDPIVIGNTALLWAKTSGGQSYTAGNGVQINSGAISVDPAVVTRKYSASVGDGTATTLTVTHNLNTQDVQVGVREVSTNAGVICDWVANGVNTVQLTFANAPSNGQFRVTIQG